MANMNRTVGERDAAKSVRSEMDAAQERTRREEARVAAAHRAPGGGTQFTGGAETQPQPQRPVIRHG